MKTKLKEAVIRQIEALKESADQIPECKDGYNEQAYGVFALWLDLAGYEPCSENEEIADMRDYCTRW